MRSDPHGSISRCLFTVLWGLALIGGLFATVTPARAMTPPAEPPSQETVQHGFGDQEPISGATYQESTASSEANDESAEEQVVEWLFGILILGPILALLLGLLLSIPSSLLGVSLVMDGGCLRYLLFLLGWLFTIVYGLLVGAVVGDLILGLDALVEPIAHVFIWGYPVAAWWTHKTFQSMPRERYRAWKQSLTGGALLGFGAGSVASLLRSTFALKGSGFGGFGGGSFGGGGASGSWSGAAGTTGGASSAAAGSTTTAAGSANAAAASAGVAPGVRGTEDSADSSTPSSESVGLLTRLHRWIQKFQWYHGLAFILVTLAFVPLGLGTVRALQNTEFFVFVLVCVVGYTGYRFLRRNADVTQSALRSLSSFRGGRASSSWS